MRKIKLLLVSTDLHDNASTLTKILQNSGYECLHIQSLKALSIISNSFQPDAVVLAHHETHGDDFHKIIDQFGGLVPIIVLMWMPGLLQRDMMRFLHFGILQIDSLEDPRIIRTIEAETKSVRDDLRWMERQ